MRKSPGEGRVQTELEKRLDTGHHRTAADMVVSRNGFITLDSKRIQEKRGSQRAMFLLGSRFAVRLQFEPVPLAEV